MPGPAASCRRSTVLVASCTSAFPNPPKTPLSPIFSRDAWPPDPLYCEFLCSSVGTQSPAQEARTASRTARNTSPVACAPPAAVSGSPQHIRTQPCCCLVPEPVACLRGAGRGPSFRLLVGSLDTFERSERPPCPLERTLFSDRKSHGPGIPACCELPLQPGLRRSQLPSPFFSCNSCIPCSLS